MYRYERFNNWCKDNGVRAPKLEYPAFFEGGLCGVRATQEIAHNEALFCVPYKLAITVDKAMKQPPLAKVFRMHPELFDKDEH